MFMIVENDVYNISFVAVVQVPLTVRGKLCNDEITSESQIVYG